jgi:hypothetical protein
MRILLPSKKSRLTQAVPRHGTMLMKYMILAMTLAVAILALAIEIGQESQ